jgi:hypothetical protein
MSLDERQNCNRFILSIYPLLPCMLVCLLAIENFPKALLQNDMSVVLLLPHVVVCLDLAIMQQLLKSLG